MGREAQTPKRLTSVASAPVVREFGQSVADTPAGRQRHRGAGVEHAAEIWYVRDLYAASR